MYQTGDYIVYGSVGVCRVEEVGPVQMDGVEQGRLYYTLIPLYCKGSQILTPADHPKVYMRSILSKKEANALIAQISAIDTLTVLDEKHVEEVYRNAVRTHECKDLVRVIKTSYLRKQARIKEGKKAASQDEKYFTMAEDSLYGELAISLNVDKEEVKDLIARQCLL